MICRERCELMGVLGVALVCLLLSCGAAVGQRVGLEVVAFSTAEESLERVDGDWLEFAVDLVAGRNPLPEARNPGFLDDVGVRLKVAYESRAGLVFFAGEARLVSLEERERRRVYFYLPPVVVRRDGLRGDPIAALVELSVGERDLPLAEGMVYGSALRDAERVENFREKVEEATGGQEGVLVPIYLTPFYNDENYAEKLAVSPDYVRREARR